MSTSITNELGQPNHDASPAVLPAGAPPLDSFTHNQWYCHQAKQSVYLITFCDKPLSCDTLLDYAIHIARLAPQVLEGYATPEASDEELRKLFAETIDVRTVDDLSVYPDAFNTNAEEIFERLDLPMIRFKAVNLPDGETHNGHCGAFLALSTHALFEGLDVSTLSRGQSVDRSHKSDLKTERRWFYETLFALASYIVAPIQILLANFTVPDKMDFKLHGVAIERERIRRLCQAYGVRQRGLIYALATSVMCNGGKSFGRRKLAAIVAELDPAAKRTNDDYFQFRMVAANLHVTDDIPAFARAVDKTIGTTEETRAQTTQIMLNAFFRTHRWLVARVPFIYTEKVFRYVLGIHIDLSIVPPLKPSGPLSDVLAEPFHGGTFHRGLNCCVFTPGRQYLTFNFTVREHMIEGVKRLPELIAQLEAELELPQ